MAAAKDGDTVRVHYTGTLDDGMVFDTSREGEPMEFTIGMGMVIPGFEKIVIGMNVGENRSMKLTAEDCYGPRRPEMVFEVERGQFPPNAEPTIGQQVEIGFGAGQTMIVAISEISDAGVTLDANHPLAGEDLTFAVELVEIL